MATAKKATKAPAAKKAAAKTTRSAKSPARAQASADIRPVKQALTKAALATHVAEQSAVKPKAVKAVLATLEATILGSVHKKGLGEFTLPGLVKITAQAVLAKKRRFDKDPFTGEERWFEAKPSSVRLKVRALKKLKDAAA